VQRVTFDTRPELVFADLDSRRIRGLAVPLGETARSGGKTFRFSKDSIRFGARVPLLQYHDPSRPIGRLVRSGWTDRGLEVEFAISKTDGGDEALVLAADGVLGLSVGIDVAPDGVQLGKDDVLDVRLAAGKEVSLTPIPAFAGAVVDAVALSDAPEIVATEGEPVTVTADTEVAPTVTVNLDAAALGESIALAMSSNTTTNGPVPQPVPMATVSRDEPLYKFDGTPGRYGFVSDLRDAHRGDAAAQKRLDEHLAATFAVSTSNVGALSPKGNRPDLYVDQLRYTRPLGSLVSGGTLTDGNPFTIPRFGTSAGLVGDHTEGVEPTPGSFTVTDTTVTPGAISGKAEINREAWDRGGNPAIDTLVWREMLAGYYEMLEAKIGDLLDGLTLTPVDITGVDADVVNGITGELVAAQFRRGGNRFSALALNEALFTALANAADGDGRKLLPLLAPSNADGQISSGFGRVSVGGLTGVPAYGLTDHSYLFVPTSVYQFATAPKRFDFNVRVKSVDIGIWGYHAEFVTRTADVLRIDYAA
jgi:hypothetical protein